MPLTVEQERTRRCACALRQQCLSIFGSNWSLAVAERLARACIQEWERTAPAVKRVPDPSIECADLVVALIDGRVVVLKNRDGGFETDDALDVLVKAAAPVTPTFALELAALLERSGIHLGENSPKAQVAQFLTANLIDFVDAEAGRDTASRREPASVQDGCSNRPPMSPAMADVTRRAAEHLLAVTGTPDATIGETVRMARRTDFTVGGAPGKGLDFESYQQRAAEQRSFMAPRFVGNNPNVVLTSKEEIVADLKTRGPGPDGFYRYDPVTHTITDKPDKPSPELEAMAKAAFQSAVARGEHPPFNLPPMAWETESEALRQDWRDSISVAMLKLKEVWGPHAADPLAQHAAPVVDRVLR